MIQCTQEGCQNQFAKHNQLQCHVAKIHFLPRRKPYPCKAEGVTKFVIIIEDIGVGAWMLLVLVWLAKIGTGFKFGVMWYIFTSYPCRKVIPQESQQPMGRSVLNQCTAV